MYDAQWQVVLARKDGNSISLWTGRYGVAD